MDKNEPEETPSATAPLYCPKNLPEFEEASPTSPIKESVICIQYRKSQRLKHHSLTTTMIAMQAPRITGSVIDTVCMNIEDPNDSFEDKRNQLNTSSVGSIESMDEFSDDDSESVFQPGPLENKCVEVNETVTLLQGLYRTLDEIPPGRKDGMFFILENGINIRRREKGRGRGGKSLVWDDCGAWKNAKTPVTHFLRRNVCLRTIVKHKGLY